MSRVPLTSSPRQSAPTGALYTLRSEWQLEAFCICVAAIALFYNLFGGPDVLYDEAAYTWAAQQVALGWHLTLDNQPLFVHPPLTFLIQAGWLRLMGSASASLPSAIDTARLLAASIGMGDVLLVASLAYKLINSVTPLRRRVLTGIVAVLTALDPVLIRYDRQNVIEPFALFISLVTMHMAWRLRKSNGLTYASVIGVLGGLALLTNEITFFLIIVPVIFALLERNPLLIRRSIGALGIALAFLSLFFVWALELGQGGSFISAQTITLQRLIGTVQTTGLNVPGISLLGALERSVTQYSSSYIVLAIGIAALIWCWSRRNNQSGNLLTAWLTASYAFGAYIVAVGTLNEQFFVYLLPATIVGSVLLVDALIVGCRRRLVGRKNRQARYRRGLSWASMIAGIGFAGVFLLSGFSWIANYSGPSDGVPLVDKFIAAHLPACAAINASGDPQKYSLLLDGRSFAYFSVGSAALADGVHYFILAPNDAIERTGNMSPALEAWIKDNGKEIVSFPSQVYKTVQLWYVPSSSYDPVADIVDIPGGVAINTVGSHCGGFTVTDSNNGSFYTGYQAVGGKGIVGAPLSRVVTLGKTEREQFFDGVVLIDTTTGAVGVKALPIVEMLATQAPAVYQRAGLPPVQPDAAPTEGPGWLTNSEITRAYLGVGRYSASRYSAAVQRYGRPLGPPVPVAGGGTEQSFADVVLEVPPNGGEVHAVTVTPDVLAAGLLEVPSGAREPQSLPPLPNAFPVGRAEPTTGEPFVLTLAGALLLFGLVVLALAKHQQRLRRHSYQSWRQDSDWQLRSGRRPSGRDAERRREETRPRGPVARPVTEVHQTAPQPQSADHRAVSPPAISPGRVGHVPRGSTYQPAEPPYGPDYDGPRRIR